MNTVQARLAWLPQVPVAGVALAVVLVILGMYAQTAQSIVAIWNSSETYAHGYVIAPISLWLIWKRRHVLAQIAPRPCWPALLGLAACGLAWLLAELADVQVVRQYALVAMLPLAVVAVLGTEMGRAMAFPLLFLLLAVPFGEVFVSPLIGFTADFTVAALQATGIPVLRNGSNFEIPSGSWSVVEACSGVRYLISSFTLGCLYAYLSYRSRLRQLMFVLIAIVVPILANGLRAYMIVMLGHLSGNRLAVGVDHLIYGWIFFGIVMFVMFWIGGMWREEERKPQAATADHASAPQAAASATPATSATSATFAAAALALAIPAFWPWYAARVEQAASATPPLRVAALPEGWEDGEDFTAWTPDFTSPTDNVRRFYRAGNDHVALSILYYRDQGTQAKLISSSNRFLAEREKRWVQAGSQRRIETFNGRQLAVREERMQGRSDSLVVWWWYWIDGHAVTNDYVGKLYQARQKFMLRGGDGAAVMVYAPYDLHAEEARRAMRAFLSRHLDQIEAALEARRRPEAR